jgi:hypothetical protein
VLTEAELFAFFIPEYRGPFFQSFPQLFHNAAFRKRLLGKASGLHWNCQHFSMQRSVAHIGTCDGKR